ncbi:MAG: ABC transporter ATP-binding protein [Bacteroidales bacterium]|nr:ABC transporter ATP-binding protein [Bacteroidales bacterium]
MEIYRNEIFGLLGPNGAGKTTTINMICGLLPVSEGKITFPGNVRKDRRSFIGYCPQENIYYPKLTCLEQLLFMGQMYDQPFQLLKKRAFKLLHLLGLDDKTNVMAGNLSGGMKRRLNICLALIHDPEIVILDEPEAGLDPQSRMLVRDYIRSCKKEKTVILTTHNMDEADRITDRLAIIDHGKLLLLDTPQNLKKTMGEGDILEMLTEDVSESVLNDFIEKMKLFPIQLTRNGNILLFTHTDMINRVVEIKKLAEESGLKIEELKFRENTLEDVFIHLTGRSLRQ